MALSLERRALFRVGVRFGWIWKLRSAGADPRSPVVFCARVFFWHTRLSDTYATSTHKLFIGLDTHYTDRTEVRADM